MSAFSFAVDLVLQNEGGLSDNPHDQGGITNFGISFRFYKTIYPDAIPDDIKNLTREQAIEIYKTQFWDNSRFAEVNCQIVSNLCFDMHVNMGLAAATKILQRSLCSVSGNANSLLDDGIFGDNTLHATNNLQEYDLLVVALRSERAGYYRDIVTKDPSQKAFLEGWLNRAYGM